MLDTAVDMWWERYLLKKKMQIVFGIVFLFLVSFVMSCQELRYMISGKTLDAGAALRVDAHKENGVLIQNKALTYHYMDGQSPRENTISVPMSFNLDSSNMVKVQYIPGRDLSRLQGQSNRI